MAKRVKIKNYNMELNKKQEEYERWRYRYPEFDTTQRWVKVPSQALSDMLVEDLKEEM